MKPPHYCTANLVDNFFNTSNDCYQCLQQKIARNGFIFSLMCYGETHKNKMKQWQQTVINRLSHHCAWTLSRVYKVSVKVIRTKFWINYLCTYQVFCLTFHLFRLKMASAGYPVSSCFWRIDRLITGTFTNVQLCFCLEFLRRLVKFWIYATRILNFITITVETEMER